MDLFEKNFQSIHMMLRKGSYDENIFNNVILNDEYQLYSYFHNIFNEESSLCVLDVGAHIGSFTIKAKNAFPNAKIFSFEPLKENFHLLKENTDGLSDIQLFNYPVIGNELENGDSVFFMNNTLPNNEGGFSIIDSIGKEDRNFSDEWKKKFGNKSIIEVGKPKTFQDVIQENKLEKIDILKLDCEGAEFSILQYTPFHILDNIKFIIGEYHEHGLLLVDNKCNSKKNLKVFLKRLKEKFYIKGLDRVIRKKVGPFICVNKEFGNKKWLKKWIPNRRLKKLLPVSFLSGISYITRFIYE